MRGENKRSVLVGVFVFLGIAILVVGILTLGGQQKKFVKGDPSESSISTISEVCRQVITSGFPE